MLRILEGGFSKAAEEEIYSEILRLTKEGKRAFLIVPEQQTVLTEGELARYLPSYAALTFEVTNFTRLGNTVSRTVGGIAKEYASKSKEALIMWRTLTELSPFLYMTENSKEINTGAVEKALSAVSEMKSLSLLPEEIEKAAALPRISKNGRLIGKLLDISKIMALYTRLLSESIPARRTRAKGFMQSLSSIRSCFPEYMFL
jgi:ATP-dependent helicase/DNAse subunit B